MNNSIIYPCIWCDNNGGEMVAFYRSVFKQSAVFDQNELAMTFELNGSRFMVLNGGPRYKPTPAISFVVSCETQDEIDFYWDHLAHNGRHEQCGWLTDQFGVSWQIVPSVLPKLLADPNRQPAVFAALMKMTKLNIQQLEEA